MIASRIIEVLFVSGAKVAIGCRDAGEAQAIMAELAGALQQQPVIAVESETTSIIIASAQVACVSLGETVTTADPQIPLPRPRPVPKRAERGVMIAN
ncbi:hypothetical protein [Bradyrhizobium sp. SZCCHNR3003]|uniref:hypothetical protein n=1 Tax=Bradyrhizobium sp. SZCCHNR3003 TaxID=3057387 RepID=UPI002916AFB2|nr:hypothetical protein [Bradyrhizobium sp. SZCCHNR3003]